MSASEVLMQPLSDQKPHEDSFAEEHEKIIAELNSSAFTFAHGHNVSIANDHSQIIHNNYNSSHHSNSNSNNNHYTERSPQKQSNEKQVPSKNDNQLGQELNILNNLINECTFSAKETIQPEYEICAYCSRQFFIGRLALHQKSCRPSHPLRPLNLLKINNIVSELQGESNQKSSSNLKSLKRFPNHSVNSLSGLVTCVSPSHSKQQQIEDKSDKDEMSLRSSLVVPKWKLEHQSLQINLKSPKDVIQQFDPIVSQYVSCQYCHRKFKPKVAEQHIPNCKNIFNRPKPPKALQKTSEGDLSLQFRCFELPNSTPTQIELKRVVSENFSMGKEYALLSRESKSPSLRDEKQIIRMLQNSPKRIRSIHKRQVNLETQSDQRSQLTTQHSSHKQLSTQQTTSHCDPFDQSDQLDHSVRSFKGGYSTKESSQISALPSIFEKNQSKGQQRKKDSFSAVHYDEFLNKSKNQIILCQHCGRKFGKQAATRHIPTCQSSQNKTIHLLKKSQTSFSLNQKTLTMLFNKNKQALDQDISHTNNNNNNTTTTTANNNIINMSTNNLFGSNISKDKQTEKNMQGLFCTNCGSKLSFTFKYCCSCGKKRI